jgi:hypothetical protein
MSALAYGQGPLPSGYRIAPEVKRDETKLRDDHAAFLAEELAHAWLTGQDRVEAACGTEKLSDVLSECMGDPDLIVRLVRMCANGEGELRSLALEIMADVGKTFGQDTAYIMADKGLLGSDT